MYFHMKLKFSGSNAPIVTSGPMTGVRFHPLMNLQLFPHYFGSLKPFVTLGPNAGNGVLIGVDCHVIGKELLTSGAVLTTRPFAPVSYV